MERTTKGQISSHKREMPKLRIFAVFLEWSALSDKNLAFF